MGKKIISKTCSQSQKISKNRDNKQQLNNMIEFLKPKVYITDSSNFKKLVQELTGNGGEIRLNCSALPAITQPFEDPVMPIVIHNVEGDKMYRENWSLVEFSLDSSEGTEQMSFDSAAIESSMVPRIQEPFIGMDNYSLQYKKIESWLLDTDSYHFDDLYVPLVQHDVYAPMVEHDLQNVSVYNRYDIPCSLFDDNYQIQY